MKASDKLFAGSIPALYDHYLGPLIFEPYADDLAARVGELRPGRILETAAGTGVVTRALRRTLPVGVEIVATDLNQPMLDFAAAAKSLENVIWRQADALALPFPDGSFDAVLCQFGIMFFPDKPAAYREARRVLRPGGMFLFSVWDRIEENHFTHVLTEAVAGQFPDDPPRFLSRTPHGHWDKAVIERDLAVAGFSLSLFETVARTSRAATPRDPAVGLCQGTPLRNEIESRAPGRLDEMTDVATAALAARFGSGPIEGKIQAIVVAAG